MISSIFRDPSSPDDKTQSIKHESNIREYQWYDRWLKGFLLFQHFNSIGDEYSHVLQHYKEYCNKYNLQIYSNVPKFIYLAPKNGTIFFLKGSDLKEVRFPKLEDFQKKYKWKKMNFITHLPKKDPKVSYLVASTYSMEASPCFRMHLVVLYNNRLSLKLCHILQIYPRQNENENLLASPQTEPQFEKLDNSLLMDPNWPFGLEKEILPKIEEIKIDASIKLKLEEPEVDLTCIKVKVEESGEPNVTVDIPILSSVQNFPSIYYNPCYNPMRAFRAEFLPWESWE